MSAAALTFALAMWPFWFALGVCAALMWCERAGHRPPAVGRCGDRLYAFVSMPPNVCELPHGHAGWHRDGLTEWTGARP